MEDVVLSPYRAALCNLCFMTWMRQKVQVRVCVHVDEAGRQAVAGGVDDS